MPTATIGISDAKAHFSRITADINATGMPVTVFKNNKPWVEIRPLASQRDLSLPKETREAIEEAQDMHDHPDKYASYESAEALFDALGI